MSHPLYSEPYEFLQHVTIKTNKGRKITLSIGESNGWYRLHDRQEDVSQLQTQKSLRENYPPRRNAAGLIEDFLRRFEASSPGHGEQITELHGDGVNSYVSFDVLRTIVANLKISVTFIP